MKYENDFYKSIQKTDEEIVEKLIELWGYGMTDSECCSIIDISLVKLRAIYNANPDLIEFRDIIKNKPQAQARMNIVTQIAEGDLETSKWYMERKNKAEFSNKIGLDISAELSPISAEEKLKAMNEFMSQFVDTEKETENEK